MKNNKNSEQTNILLGVVIGGLLGGSAFYLWSASQRNNKPLLDKIGKAIVDMGEILECSNIDNSKDALDEIEKTLPKGDHLVNNVLTWAATGINLWKNLKKGM